jgi:raffinose/stachyose/melibiose transport system permease protein
MTSRSPGQVRPNLPGLPKGLRLARTDESRVVRERLSGTAFLIPIALVFIVIIGVPLVRSIFYSFTDYEAFSPTRQFIGLENYRRVFTDSTLVAGLSFTLLFAVSTVILITVLAIPLAVVLNRGFRGRNLVRSMWFFPAIPSIAVLGLVWNFILNPLPSGALNSVLASAFGVDPIPWLADPTLAKLSVVGVGVWSSTGWHAVLYLAYLQTIPRDYYEVATIDGASGWQQFRFITLPLLAPAVTTSTLLLMIAGLNVYALPATLTGGGPADATYTITQSIITSGVGQGKYGQASALAVVYMVAVGLVVTAQLWLSHRLQDRSS